MASSQSDVTQIPSPLWLLQLNRAFPRGVSALGGDAAAAIPRSAPGPRPALAPGPGQRIPRGHTDIGSFATLLQPGGINSTELELPFLEELIGGMR